MAPAEYLGQPPRIASFEAAVDLAAADHSDGAKATLHGVAQLLS
jgi:hypothetical protein